MEEQQPKEQQPQQPQRPHEQQEPRQSQPTSPSPSSSSSSLPSRAESLLMRQTRPVEFALKSVRSAYTRRQYPKRLKLFFDFIGLPGGNTLEEQAQAFLAHAKKKRRRVGGEEEEEEEEEEAENQYWAEDNILLFVDFLKQRVIKKEIAPITVGTYFWPSKPSMMLTSEI